LAMDACRYADHDKTVCAGHAGLTEERSVSSFSLLVEMCTDKWPVPFICMLPRHDCYRS